MKIKNNLWFLLLSLSLFTVSCRLDLDLNPTDRITVVEFFKTKDDFKLYASGLYSQLKGIGRKNADHMSEICFATSNSVSNGNRQTPNTSGTWSNPYVYLRRSFELFKAAAKPEGKALGSAIDPYIGEAHFFIAYQYYDLLRYFGSAPLVKKLLEVSDNHYLPRSSRAEVVDYIMENLDKAIAKLPASDSSGRLVKDAARAFKARVALFEGTWRKFHGLTADANVMLDEAIKQSEAVMNGGKYSLFKDAKFKDKAGNFDSVANYYYFFTLENYLQTNIWGVNKSDNKEFIITSRYHREERNLSNFNGISRNNSYTKAFVSQILDSKGIPIQNAASVFQTDKANHGYGLKMTTDAKGRKVADHIEFRDRDPRMSALIAKPMTQLWLNRHQYPRDLKKAKEHFDGKEDAEKNTGIMYYQFFESPTGYLNLKFNGETRSSKGEQNYGYDFPVLRLAEILLIYAEAKYERSGSISDGDLDLSINKLRDRVGMPKLTNAHVTTYGLNMQEEIRRERMVELASEGFRYDDIRRWKTAETVLPKAIKGIQWTSNPLNNSAGFTYFDYVKWKEETNTSLSTKSYTLDADGFIIIEKAADRTFDPAKDYLWGVPDNEIQLYKQKGKGVQLTQNPGW